MLTPWKESYDQPREHIQKQRHYFANKGPSSQGYGFSSSHAWMWEWTMKKAEHRRIDAFELWYWENSWESLGPQRDPISASSRKPVLNVHWKDWCWSLNSNALATWCEELTHWKIPWCWERLKAGGEGDDRGWDGWMASPAWLTWVWANSRSWWCRERPGVLQSMGSQRVGHDWATELN